MMTIDPKDVSVPVFHAWLLGAVTPRPIAFASTVDKDGNVNLSPFSFFNCFGANPPLLIFSPARRGRNNTTKHTYENVLDVPEVVINVVNYSMVQQTSLASTEYPRGVNEFEKAGFTEVPSVMVKPPRVRESPVSMECKVIQVIQTGTMGAAGNLVICQVLLMHVNETILDELKKLLKEVILPEQPFEIDQRWSGIMGFTEDKQPVIRQTSERIIVGFACNGIGVSLASTAGDEIADLVLG